MSILIDRSTRVVVQGITGRDGSFHAGQMLEYGTKVVAGVTPGKAGEKVHGIPVFDSVEAAVAKTGANASVVYVPASLAQDAIYEAVDAEVPLIVCITEGIPVRDMIEVWAHLRGKSSRLVGPNCPGLISPGQCKLGIMPGMIHKPGRVGLVSRSGTLTYEVVWQLTRAGLGQSTCIGIGGDPIIGTRFLDALALFEADDATDAVVVIGEIGGTDEEEAAAYIAERLTKPVVAFVAGQTAPPGKRMGHAGAIVSGGSGTAQEKIVRFEAAGIPVARTPSEIPTRVRESMNEKRPRGLRVVRARKSARRATRSARKTTRAATRKSAKRSPAKRKATGRPKARPGRKGTGPRRPVARRRRR
jgi:succinyl-CoA synthetase alpha subunit